MLEDEITRCGWVGSDPLYVAYHDEEWGVPVHDDRHLFEMLTLEGAQAGLSWLTILKRRPGYRRVFEGFDAEAIARWGEPEIAAALLDPGIIRNRAKVESTVGNARAYLKIREEREAFAPFLWQFVGGEPRINVRRSLKEIPAETAESKAMSKELKKHGFRFVGSTICYAFMQAVGMVDDHTEGCFRRAAAPR